MDRNAREDTGLSSREIPDPDALEVNRRMFGRIAFRYDFLNRLLSLGFDGYWRRRAVAALELHNGARVLDMATGSAEMAVSICQHYSAATVVGIDPCEEMLRAGRLKVSRGGLIDRITLQTGNAASLEFDDRSFNGVVCAFGIRNMPRRRHVFREARRVLRPGGKLVIIELTMPDRRIFRAIFAPYLARVVPLVGGMLSNRDDYQYLSDSIRNFTKPEKICSEMHDMGFESAYFRYLTGGSATLFVAHAGDKR